jgi:hypothetical protein
MPVDESSTLSITWRLGLATKTETDGIIEKAKEFHFVVEKWLAAKHPSLAK